MNDVHLPILSTTRAALVALAIIGAAHPGAGHDAADVPPLSTLPLRVVGVAIDASAPSRSAALIQCGGTREARAASLHTIGEVACDLAEVRAVHPDGIVVMNLGARRIERLALASAGITHADGADVRAESLDEAGVDDIPPPVVTPTAPGIVTIELQRELLHRSLSNLPAVLTSALATAHRADSLGGTIDGYTMSRITPGGIVDQLGIRDGDVLLDFNGQRLDNLGAVTSMLARADALEGARMTVLRDGATLTFVFKVQ